MDDVGATLTAHGDTAGDRLRAAGLRATRPRLTMLRWLGANPGHHTAESVVHHTGLPKATVYHMLGQLHEAGLVLTTGSSSGRALYETATAPHHHFVCTACGAVIDVACQADASPCVDVDVPGATVHEVDVRLRGLCTDCTRTAPAAPPGSGTDDGAR